jgi:AraC family transcriptional regulator
VEHAIPVGTVLLLRPGMHDSGRWGGNGGIRHGFIHFQVDLNGATLPPGRRWPLMCSLEYGDVLRPLLMHMDWLLRERPSGWQELREGALRQVLLCFLRGAHRTTCEVTHGLHPTVSRAIGRARQAWAGGRLEPLSLSWLAHAAGVSRAHLTRLFRYQLGAGPVEAIRLLRLERASELLARGDMLVQDIATFCGFDDPFHFSRSFRGEYGCSPRVFQQRVRSGAQLPLRRLLRLRNLSAQRKGRCLRETSPEGVLPPDREPEANARVT